MNWTTINRSIASCIQVIDKRKTMQSVYIGGLDIGGTKMVATIAGPQGPLARVTGLTVKTGTNLAPGEQCISLLKAACAKAGVRFDQIDTVGVSSCGPFIKPN